MNSLKPGAKQPTTPVKLKKVSTFQEFESNTSDAWDVGDDEDELLAMATESLNTDVVMETANRVIQNHSKLQEQHKLQEELVERGELQQLSDLPPAACGDNRLVKSVSESNTSSSAGTVYEMLEIILIPRCAVKYVWLKNFLYVSLVFKAEYKLRTSCCTFRADFKILANGLMA